MEDGSVGNRVKLVDVNNCSEKLALAHCLHTWRD